MIIIFVDLNVFDLLIEKCQNQRINKVEERQMPLNENNVIWNGCT